MGNKKAAVFLITAAAGLVLRWFNPGMKPVSPEELETLRISLSGGFFEIIFSAMAASDNPPLFYLLEALFLKISGVSEFSLRLFPALINSASLFVFYKLSRSFFSEKASATAFVIFAFNPFQFYAGQQAAAYCFAQFTLMLCIYYFLMSVKYNSFTFGPFVFWSALSLYTHHSAIIVLLCMNILMFTYMREEIRPRLWLTSQLALLLIWLPLAPAFLKSAALYERASAGHPGAIFGAVKTYVFGPAAGGGVIWWVLTAAALWFILMGAVTRRRPMEKKIENAVVIMIGAVLVVPWVFSFATGFFDPYSLIIAAPFIILLFGLGISYMSEAGMAVFMVIFLGAGAFSAVMSHTSKNFTPPDYAAAFREAAKENALIAHETKKSYAAFEFYALKNKIDADNRYFETERMTETKGAALILKNVSAAVSRSFKIKLYSGEGERAVSAPGFEALAREKGKIIIVKEPGRGSFAYPAGFETTKQKDFRGVRITVIEKQGAR